MSSLLKALFSLALEGYMISNGFPRLGAWTTASCADQCLADTSCMGFFHSKESRLCLLHNSRNVSNEELTPEIGMRFYVLDKARCPVLKNYTSCGNPPVCYRAYHDKLKHYQAVEACQQDGGFLFRIDSQQKQDLVSQIHANEMPSGSGPWVDGSSEDDDDKWRFSDGTLMTYTNWESNQPGSNDCMHLQLNDGDSQWYDRYCGRTLRYICEIPTQ